MVLEGHGVPGAGFVGQSPAGGSGGDDGEDGEGVFGPGARGGGFGKGAGEGVAAGAEGGAGAAVGAAGGGGGFVLGGCCGKEGVLFSLLRGGVACLRVFFFLVFLCVEGIVVNALRDQRAVREAEVDCQRDHGRHETCPEPSRERQDVAGGPDEEESHGDAVGVAIGVVLDQLRDEQEDPGGERDGAQDAAESFRRGERDGGVHCWRRGAVGRDGDGSEGGRWCVECVVCGLSSQWVVYLLVLASSFSTGQKFNDAASHRTAPGTVQCDVKACSTPVCEHC